MSRLANQIPSWHSHHQTLMYLNTLPRKTRRILAQLRAGKSPVLTAYLHTIDSKSYPSPICPLCKSHDHTTQHLFSCPIINTTLTARDLWDDPVAVAALLQQWDDALGAAGGGLGSSLTTGWMGQQ